jgi:hypothetical protein
MGVNWGLNPQSRRLPGQPAHLPYRRSHHLRHLGSNPAGAVQGNAEFDLNEFFDDNIPTYAILSHTWGANGEEVTFKDMMRGAGKGKAGYHKIRFLWRTSYC